MVRKVTLSVKIQAKVNFEGMGAKPHLAQQVEFNSTYGAAVTYSVSDDLKLTAGFNRGELTVNYAAGRIQSVNDFIYGAGVTWGNFNNDGLYFAANINKNENHSTRGIHR